MNEPRIVDMHAHAFPDAIAARAVPELARAGNVAPASDGTLRGLVASMDRAGIATSVVCSIATKPAQFDKILAWSEANESDRLVMLPSIHPADPAAVANVRRVAEAGLRGIKLHPYYQEFEIDEPRLFPVYEAAQDLGLVIVCHGGFDIAYPHTRIADPVRARRVVDAFPGLKFVVAHMGGWEDWDEVERHLLGRPVYLDTSYSLAFLPADRARRLFAAHPADRILFGTDSPWADQAAEVARFRALGLPENLERRILGGNASEILGGSTKL
jgi:hypothetical protein